MLSPMNNGIILFLYPYITSCVQAEKKLSEVRFIKQIAAH